MKSPVASSSICPRSMYWPLNFQSNVSKVAAGSRNLAFLMRSSVLCSRRFCAGTDRTCSISCTCEKRSFSARRRTSSNSSGLSRNRNVWLCSKIRCRRSSLVFLGRLVIVVRFLEQFLVIGRGAWSHRLVITDAGTILLVEQIQRRSRTRLHRQDPFQRVAGEGAVAHGSLDGGPHIVAVVHRHQAQHLAGLVLAVAV